MNRLVSQYQNDLERFSQEFEARYGFAPEGKYNPGRISKALDQWSKGEKSEFDCDDHMLVGVFV